MALLVLQVKQRNTVCILITQKIHLLGSITIYMWTRKSRRKEGRLNYRILSEVPDASIRILYLQVFSTLTNTLLK